MGKYEDLIEQLRNGGDPEDIADELEQFKGSSLRSKAERTESLEKEKEELLARITELEEAPKREKAFKDYGVDLDGLKPAEAELLKGLKVEGDLTAEKVGEIVQKYDLPMVSRETAEEGEGEPAAAEVAKAAGRAAQRSSSPTITPADAAEWSTEKWMRFEAKHPEEASKVSQGDTVVGIAFQ